MKRNVFIYGGCTSRDAVEYYPKYDLELHSYIARQSLISAFNPVSTTSWSLEEINSSFQKRMIRWDIKSYLPEHITKEGPKIDLIIWALMIERVGVRPVRGGGYVTNNPQTRKHTRARILGETVKFGSPQHFDLWQEAFEQFVSLLHEAGLHSKTIINATPWAIQDKYGDQPDYPSSGMTPKYFNQTIQKYWDHAREYDLQVLSLEQETAISDPDHKWGPAYFHYVPETYIAQLEALSRVTRS